VHHEERTCVIGVAGLAAVCGSVAAQPQIEELGWVLEREIDFADPISALYNPADGRIYAGDRDNDVFVVNEDGSRSAGGQHGEVAGLAVDPRTGDLYMTEDFPGRVRRIAFGTTDRRPIWVSGFDGATTTRRGCASCPRTTSARCSRRAGWR
jgi:hypothetical protein